MSLASVGVRVVRPVRIAEESTARYPGDGFKRKRAGCAAESPDNWGCRIDRREASDLIGLPANVWSSRPAPVGDGGDRRTVRCLLNLPHWPLPASLLAGLGSCTLRRLTRSARAACPRYAELREVHLGLRGPAGPRTGAPAPRRAGAGPRGHTALPSRRPPGSPAARTSLEQAHRAQLRILGWPCPDDPLVGIELGWPPTPRPVPDRLVIQLPHATQRDLASRRSS